MTDMIDQIKPSWTYRRRYIKNLLFFLSICISVTLLGALVLGFFGKINIYLSAFLIVFIICNFMTLLGIIGSYIFGSRWETKDFLDVLPNIIPKMTASVNEAVTESDGLNVQDILKRD